MLCGLTQIQRLRCIWRQLVGCSNQLQATRKVADPPLDDNLEGAFNGHLEAVHDALSRRSPQLFLCPAHTELKIWVWAKSQAHFEVPIPGLGRILL